MRLFCRHVWTKTGPDKMPSAMEQMSQGGTTTVDRGDLRMFRQKWIYWLRCEKCQKLKKIEVINTAF